MRLMLLLLVLAACAGTLPAAAADRPANAPPDAPAPTDVPWGPEPPGGPCRPYCAADTS